jgi:hypothetical protein
MTAFATVIDQVSAQPPGDAYSEWLFHVSGDDIAGQVLAAGAQVVTEPAQTYAFISLRAA